MRRADNEGVSTATSTATSAVIEAAKIALTASSESVAASRARDAGRRHQSLGRRCRLSSSPKQLGQGRPLAGVLVRDPDRVDTTAGPVPVPGRVVGMAGRPAVRPAVNLDHYGAAVADHQKVRRASSRVAHAHPSARHDRDRVERLELALQLAQQLIDHQGHITDRYTSARRGGTHRADRVRRRRDGCVLHPY
ncbi:hypothetical protein [Actinomycetospora chibensis]|uniref:Uncharacterized protein n=1 Tax=Actinomycetospora chibensis TaxID=663606 RepID=A0ABV9RD79_9PSEU|nr:hypothetical protein [Actinomycetospora chibensis]MDD7925016.1 hypothetical protein [Actinomycetospora chibensis]